MVRSTFAGFTTAYLALQANQRAIDVTGQNISNEQTEGYTRQRLDLASITPTGNGYGNMQANTKVGQGVYMTGVIQIRDPYVDIQYRNQMSMVGTTEAQDAFLADVGNVFDEVDNSEIREDLSNIISMLNNMASPESVAESSSDAMVRSSMQVLINALHQKSVELAQIRSDTEAQLQDTDIANLNTYLENIVSLNKSIKDANVLGAPALELVDERNALIDKVAEYVPSEVSYRTVNMGSGISVDTLHINMQTSDGVGIPLIDDCVDPGQFSVDIDNPTRVILRDTAGGDNGDVADVLEEGKLRGILDVLNKSGEYDNTNFRGLGYYEKSLDAIVNQFATTFNDMNKAAATITQQADGSYAVTAFEDRPLFETLDGSTTFTAANISIANDWVNNVYGITKSVTPDITGKIGGTDYTNVLKMIDSMSASQEFLLTDGTGGVYFNGSFAEAFENLQNVQAVDRQASSQVLKNRNTVLNQISDTKDSISSVSTDEEIINLMRFQRSYSATSRFMTTLDELLDKLINGTGTVGR